MRPNQKLMFGSTTGRRKEFADGRLLAPPLGCTPIGIVNRTAGDAEALP